EPAWPSRSSTFDRAAGMLPAGAPRPKVEQVPVIGTLNEGLLHTQLKAWYRRPGDQFETPVDGYVIDIVRGDTLIEIQTGGFAPLRRKLDRLLDSHRVRLVARVPLTQIGEQRLNSSHD